MPHRILIGIKSCERDARNGANEAIRKTWGRDLPGLRFFVGGKRDAPHGPTPQGSIIVLDCPDTYEGLPQKTRAILRYGLDHERDFIFLFDSDTFVVPERLLACGFENYDLTGSLGGNTENGKYYPWPSGGAGYILSNRAARFVVDAPPSEEWAEDRMVGQILGPHIKSGEVSCRNHPGFGRDEAEITDITTHFCARGLHREYDPKWMFEMFERNKATK